MKHAQTWYDSTNPRDRRVALELWFDDAGDGWGKLWEARRSDPSDVWPASVCLGGGYSLSSAGVFAAARGLVRDDSPVAS